MRALLALVALGQSIFAYAQNLPPDGSYKWSVGQQGEDVYTVVVVSWKWELDDTFTFVPYSKLGCGGYCLGKKHLLHDQCDRSCDDACNRIHQDTVWPEFSHPENTEALDEDMRKFGASGDLTGYGKAVYSASVKKSGLQAYMNDPANRLVYSFPCWNTEPCTVRYKSIDFQGLTCTLTFSLKREVGMPDGSVVTTQGPVRTMTISCNAAVPGSVKDTDRKSAWCRCSVVSDQKDDFGFLDKGNGSLGVACVDGDGRHALDGKQIAGLGLTIVGQSMDKFTVTVSNRPPGCDKLVIPAGWEFRCDDGSLQDTLLTEDAELAFIAGSNVATLVLNRDPRPWDVFTYAAKDVRTLCLNIKKREPEPGKTYSLQPPSSPETVALARITRDSRFKGPWDQTRLWIVTDRASMDDVNKVLLPGPTPRMYLRELWTVVDKDLFSIDPAKDAKIVDNRLFVSAAPDQAPLDWFVRWKLDHDKDKSLSWIRSNAKSFAALFKDGKESDAAEGVSILAGALSEFGGDDGTKTAMDLLLNPALNDFRGIVANDSHSGTVIAPLTWTTDPVTANRILDYIEACKPAAGILACRNVAPGLPQEVKDRAAKLITVLEGRFRE